MYGSSSFNQVLRIRPRSVAPLPALKRVEHAGTWIDTQSAECLHNGGRIIECKAARPALICVTAETGHVHIRVVLCQPALCGYYALVGPVCSSREKRQDPVGRRRAVTPKLLPIMSGLVGVVFGC